MKIGNVIMGFTIITFIPILFIVVLMEYQDQSTIEKVYKPPEITTLLYKVPFYKKYEIGALEYCDKQFTSRGGFAILVWQGITKAKIIEDIIDPVGDTAKRYILLWELKPFFDGTIDITSKTEIKKYVVKEWKDCRAVINRLADGRHNPEYSL